MTKIISLLFSLFLISAFAGISEDPAIPAPVPAATAGGIEIPVWPEGKMPGKGAALPEETGRNKNNVLITSNVSKPTLTFFKSPGENTSKPAVIICPGGSYKKLAFEKEGTELATWFNALGMHAFVLKYRVPDNKEGAFADIQRAVRLVRDHATEWGIDPTKLGIMGFSAGGHLCATLDTRFGETAYESIDAVDQQNCRPDFTILVYPAYLESNGVMDPSLTISSKIPPTLIVHTEDDKNFIAGSKLFASALKAAGVDTEYLLYPTGGHGYGLHCKGDAKIWPDQCKEWLMKHNLLPNAAK